MLLNFRLYVIMGYTVSCERNIFKLQYLFDGVADEKLALFLGSDRYLYVLIGYADITCRYICRNGAISAYLQYLQI